MNVSSSPFSSFGAFLFLLLGFLVLTLTLDDALAKDDVKPATDAVKVDKPGLDDWSIISDIVASRRTILLFASLSTHMLVIVSASGATSLTTDAIVFEQPSSTLTGTSLTLTSGQLLKDKWPQLIPSTGSLAVLSDNNGHYLAIANSGQLHLFNLATKERIPDQQITDPESKTFFDKAILLSSSEVMSLYSFHHESNIWLGSGIFGGNSWTSLPNGKLTLSIYYLCNSGQAQFIWKLVSPTCAQPAWRITSGAIIDSSVYLIDASTSSIIKFDKSAFTSGTNTTFTTLPFASFWAKPPTLPPTTTHKSTTHVSKLGFYIGMGVFPVCLIILGLMVYCFCCRASKPLLTKSFQPITEGSKEGVARLGEDGRPEYKWNTPAGVPEHKWGVASPSGKRTTPPANEDNGGYWAKTKSCLVHIPTKMPPAFAMPKKRRTSSGALAQRKTSKRAGGGSKQSFNKRQTSRQVRDASQSRNVAF